MSSDLFRYHESVKLFGVIPLYDKTIEQNDLDREEVAVPPISKQSSPSDSDETLGQGFDDFWS